MSLSDDFYKAWNVQFPGEDVPTALEEDIQTCLISHKTKLESLKTAIKKEEFYVKYLEELITLENFKKSKIKTDENINENSTTFTNDQAEFKESLDRVLGKSLQQEKIKEVIKKPVASNPGHSPSQAQVVRTYSADSPSKSVFKNPHKWSTEYIQKNLVKTQPLQVVEESVSIKEATSPNYENVRPSKIGLNPKSKPITRADDYENVFDDISMKTDRPTDLITNSGIVKKNAALFTKPIACIDPSKSSGAAASRPVLCDHHYDMVSQEGHHTYADNYATVDNSDDDDRKSVERGTLESFSSTLSEDSSNSFDHYQNVNGPGGLTKHPSSKQRAALKTFLETEESYNVVLNILVQYEKSLTASSKSSQPVISQDEVARIFFHIPELYKHHVEFLRHLKSYGETDWNNVSKVFHLMHRHSKMDLPIYSKYLGNFSSALETLKSASQHSTKFGEMAREVKFKTKHQQSAKLEDLLHTPVSRAQRFSSVIKDLMDCTAVTEQDYSVLNDAHKLVQTFLNEVDINELFKFPSNNKKHQPPFQYNRHLVKNNFMVEVLTDSKKKMRHFMLFTDVLVCTKYKNGSTEIKWYSPLSQLTVQIDESTSKQRASSLTAVALLRSEAASLLAEIDRSTSSEKSARKRLAELENKLLIDSPNLPLKMIHKNKSSSRNSTTYTYLLSSEYERTLWVEAIDTLKRKSISESAPISYEEIESLVKASRGSIDQPKSLVKYGQGQTLRGHLYLKIHTLKGLPKPSKFYVVIELDSFGHYFTKAQTKMIYSRNVPEWEEEFNLELAGSRGLRILVYEEDSKQVVVLRGKAHLDLTLSWLKNLPATKMPISITNQCKDSSLNLGNPNDELGKDSLPSASPNAEDLILMITLRYSNDSAATFEQQLPTSSLVFGVPIEDICGREKKAIPFVLDACMKEVELRGINEVGIYRVPGLATDINKLRKDFDTGRSRIELEKSLKEVEVSSVGGVLKLFLRQLPQPLFSDNLYPEFQKAYSQLDLSQIEDGTVEGTRTLVKLFSRLPPTNQIVIEHILDHLIRINKKEISNKMSLKNLATVFGPTLLRASQNLDVPENLEIMLAQQTTDVMVQAGILHFFLFRRSRGL